MTTSHPNPLPDITALQGATRLPDWGVIRALGVDARSFLHSQLTQDTLHLEKSQARLAGFCSAKGRLQASFVLWCTSPDEVFLACSTDLLAAVLKRLSMFVLRAKCKLSDASAEVLLWGVVGGGPTGKAERRDHGNSSDNSGSAGASTVMPGEAWACADVVGGQLIRLPDALSGTQRLPRCLLALQNTATVPQLPLLDHAAWSWLEARSGTARIVAATAEQFVPQMVNFELVGGVNFQKGCYPGQEIVARSQYRGTLKRRAFVLDSTEPAHAGQEVFSASDPSQPAGMVVLAGSWQGTHSALVELKTAAMHAGGLHLGNAVGALLTPNVLPYAIPTDAP